MVLVTGRFVRLDGGPAAGTVKLTPSRSPILDRDGKVVISGPQTFALNKDGQLTTEIPASNDPDIGPPVTYTLDVLLAHAAWKLSKVFIPHGTASIDLADLEDYAPVPGVPTRTVTIPADGQDGQVLVWDGTSFTWDYPPKGEPGDVSLAQLETKVTGPGPEIRHDTTAGTKISLAHPGGETVIHYDSGWRALCRWEQGAVTEGTIPDGLAPRGDAAGGIFVRRGLDTITVAVVEANVVTTSPQISLPAGFRGKAGPYPAVPIYYRDASLSPKIANAEFGASFIRYRDVPAGATLSAAGTGGYGVMATAPAASALPTSLPGKAA